MLKAYFAAFLLGSCVSIPIWRRTSVDYTVFAEKPCSALDMVRYTHILKKNKKEIFSSVTCILADNDRKNGEKPLDIDRKIEKTFLAGVKHFALFTKAQSQSQSDEIRYSDRHILSAYPTCNGNSSGAHYIWIFWPHRAFRQRKLSITDITLVWDSSSSKHALINKMLGKTRNREEWASSNYPEVDTDWVQILYFGSTAERVTELHLEVDLPLPAPDLVYSTFGKDDILHRDVALNREMFILMWSCEKPDGKLLHSLQRSHESNAQHYYDEKIDVLLQKIKNGLHDYPQLCKVLNLFTEMISAQNTNARLQNAWDNILSHTAAPYFQRGNAIAENRLLTPIQEAIF